MCFGRRPAEEPESGIVRVCLHGGQRGSKQTPWGDDGISSYHGHHLQVLNVRPLCGQQLLGDEVGPVCGEPLEKEQKQGNKNTVAAQRKHKTEGSIQKKLCSTKRAELITNLPPDLVLVVGADAAGVVEQWAGERGRLSAVRTVAAQVQRLLAIDHGVWATGGRRQVGAVGACSCSRGEGKRSERDFW